MVRVVARRRHHAGGAFVSAHVAVARFDTDPPPWAALTAAVDDVAGDDAVLADELWEAVSDDGATVEAGLRDGPDAGAAGAALVRRVDASGDPGGGKTRRAGPGRSYHLSVFKRLESQR